MSKRSHLHRFNGVLAPSSPAMRWGMYVCCAVMVLPVAGFLGSGGALVGLAPVLAPLLLCVAMHLMLYKVTGKSCRSAQSEALKVVVADTAQGDRASEPAA